MSISTSISSFNNELQKQEVILGNQSHTSEIKVPLYHYTTTDGFYGIIQSHNLWASSAYFANDNSEITYGCNLVAEIVNKKLQSSTSSIEKEFLKQFSNPNSSSFDFFKNDCVVFLICFCEEGDLLSQWRGYTNKGQGYSIGFNIRDIDHNLLPGFLGKVIYEREQQEPIIKKIVDVICGIFNKTLLENSLDDCELEILIEHSCRHLSFKLLDYILLFKDMAFKEEKEWRFISIKSPSSELHFNLFHFRTLNNRIVPYIEIDFSNKTKSGINILPIEHIVYGPTMHPQLTEKSTYLFLKKYGYSEDIRIDRSAIPFQI